MSTACHGPAARRDSPGWHGPFLSLLPALERLVFHEVRGLPPTEQEEALQAAVASAAVACARLFELNKAHLVYAGPLARYGLKQYRVGRLVGGRLNTKDVGSVGCRRQRGCLLEPLDDWKEALTDGRRANPAELAALRVDFSDWLGTLSDRDQRLVQALAAGEGTGGAAEMFRLTAGRVSQLRRELYRSWLAFLGEPMAGAG